MTLASQENYTIICSHCQASNPFTAQHVIHKQNDPEQVDKLVNGELFKLICNQCQQLLPVPYPCFYEDADKQFCVFLVPEHDANTEQLTPAFFGQDKDYSNYTMRLTHFVPEFYEKINTLSSEYLDTEVEAVKLLTYTVLKEQHPEADIIQIHFSTDDNGPKLIVVERTQNSVTDYNKNLVEIVRQRLQHNQLLLPKNTLIRVDGSWAVKALELD